VPVISARVTAHLLRAGHSVTVFDKLVYGGEALLPFNRDERFKLVRGDVRDHAAVSAALAGIDVIHRALCGVVGEPAYSIDPEQSRSINVEGSQDLAFLLRARFKTARLVFVGTRNNYGVAEPSEIATENLLLNRCRITRVRTSNARSSL
jgi:nucleoside-diphosphate-sugar epimerase